MTGKPIGNNRGGNSLEGGSKVTLVLLFVLLLLSLFYYRERMLFIDAPHILFRIINDGTLQITEHRYGSFITQLFPLVAVKLHMSLKSIMLLYSASFYLFFLAIGLVLVFRFRQYGLAVLLGLYLTLFVSDTFFWPNNEVHQGIAWLFLALALSIHLQAQKQPALFVLVVFTASCFLAIWTHPLVMLAALYLWLFFWGDYKNWPFSRSQSLIYSGILLILAFLKFNYGMHHGYDSGKIEMVTQFKPERLLAIVSSPQLHFFIKSCISNYWLVVLIAIAGLLALVRQKKYRLLSLTLAFIVGYLLLLFITYWDVRSGRFYIESEYMPLSIICATPFVYYFLPRVNKKTVSLLLAVVFCVRLGYITNSAALFTSRIAQIAQIQNKLKEKGFKKAIIEGQGTVTDDALLMNWGAPVESIFLAQLNGESPQPTYIFLDTAQIKTFNTTAKDTLLGCFEKRAAVRINRRYFSIDTSSTYTLISYDTLMKSLQH